MAHPQHNFTSNFNGSEGHNAALNLNINGVPHTYTPAGSDINIAVASHVFVDGTLPPADLVSAIQAAFDALAIPIIEESTLTDYYLYTYSGYENGEWTFVRSSYSRIVELGIASNGSMTRRTRHL